MSLHITIQPLSEIDIQQWLSLWQAYQAFYQVKIDSTISLRTWQKLTDTKLEHMYGFAAILHEQVVGIVHVIEHDSCWTAQPYAYLQDLYTHPKYRGQGIAAQLIAYVYQVSLERNCDRVYWLTQDSNEAAQKLYDRVARKTGFIQYRI